MSTRNRLADTRLALVAELVVPYRQFQSPRSRGEIDLAFAWLERAVDERSGLVAHLKVEPMFDRLRADSRFPPLIRRSGLAS